MPLKQKCKLILYKSALWGIPLILLIVLIQQWIAFRSMKESIGQYAYSSGFACRNIGKLGQYIGVVKDFRWNSLPEQEEDIRGFQPRFLIVRETEPGLMEEQWWCSYFFRLSEKPPKRYDPSPFPDLEYLDGAIK